MKFKILIFSGLLLILATVTVISCGKSSGYNSGNGNGNGNPPPSGNTLTISGMAFSPATLTVTAGTKVTWTNSDYTNHTVTADDGSFDSGSFAQGASYSKTFTVVGTYKYHCNIHSTMKGTIIVQ